MTDIHELYRTIGQQMGRLAQSFRTMGDLLLESATLAARGGDASEPESSTIPTEVRPPEMGVHKPSTVPPEGNEIAAVVATTDPAVSLSSNVCESDCALVAPHDGPCLDAEDATVVNPEEMRDPPIKPLSNLGGRKKTDMTATEWATSKHFLAYVKRTEPFSSWAAEEQNAKRDAFVAGQPPTLLMNRWGPRFRKFCGVA